MGFLRKISDSIYNPTYYLSLKDSKLSSSFWYYFGLTSILSVILSFFFGIETSKIFSGENLRKTASFFPSELTVTMKSGSMSTNVEEPYSIRETNPSSSGQKYTNLVVFDTKNDFSVDTFRKYDTRVLIGKNYIVTTKNNGQFEFNDISKVPDFTLNQQKLFDWIDKIDSHHLWISIGLFLVWIFGYAFMFLWWLVPILVLALLVMGLLRFRGIVYTYKESLKVSLRAVTLSLLLFSLSMITGFGISFPFFYTLVSLVVVLVNMKVVQTPPTLPPTQA